MLTLGNFVGPTASGFSVEAYGFEWTTVVFFGLSLAFVLVSLLTLLHELRNFEPGPDCESRCVFLFLPTGVSVASKGDNETTKLIYSSKGQSNP